MNSGFNVPPTTKSCGTEPRFKSSERPKKWGIKGSGEFSSFLEKVFKFRKSVGLFFFYFVVVVFLLFYYVEPLVSLIKR